jgi:hypothetical protein
MNTFLNIAEEFPLSLYFFRRQMGGGNLFMRDRNNHINYTKIGTINRRITTRGYREQYAQRFLSHYYGAKRKAAWYVVTANTVG